MAALLQSTLTPAALIPAALTPAGRHFVGLLALGQTPAQASETLRLAPEEAEAMLADLLRRHGLAARHQLLARALLLRWI